MKRSTIQLIAILLLILSFSFMSCGTHKTVNDNSVKKVRAHERWYSSITYQYIVSDRLDIIYVDTMSKSGDIITAANGTTYILE